MSKTKERALEMLNRRDYSRAALIDKLVEKGEDPMEAEAAVDYLVSLGFVDDARFAPIIVRHYAAKGYGRRRVLEELRRHKIAKEFWDEAMEQMPEQDDALDRFLKTKLRSAQPDRAELKKAADAALRRGYSWDEVRSALARYNATIEDN